MRPFGWLRSAASMALGEPFYALFQVTAKCNLRCRMCRVWKAGASGAELSTDQIREVAGNLAELGLRIVNLAGEPLLRPDLPEIVACFHDLGVDVRMQTNATLAGARREMVERCVQAGLRGVSISLDTLFPDKQAHICGAEDVWPRIVEGICVFAELLPTRGSVPLLNCVVSKLNLSELPTLVEFAEAIGYHVSFAPIHTSGASREDPQFARSIEAEFLLDHRDFARCDSVYRQLVHAKAMGAPIMNSTWFLHRSRDFLTRGTGPLTCDAGSRYFFVDHFGRVSACHEFPGGLRATDSDFVSAFRSRSHSAGARSIRQSCEGCLLPCWIEISEFLHRPRSTFELARTYLRAQLRKREPIDYQTAVNTAEKLRGKLEH